MGNRGPTIITMILILILILDEYYRRYYRTVQLYMYTKYSCSVVQL